MKIGENLFTSDLIEEANIADIMYFELCELGEEKSRLLWDILFEADMSDTAHMQELIYQFGSELKVNDRFGRRIFVRLASLF